MPLEVKYGLDFVKNFWVVNGGWGEIFILDFASPNLYLEA
jgi:hypothetical protein